MINKLNIIQFLYGDDSLNCSKLEKQRFYLISFDNNKMNLLYNGEIKEEYEKLMNMRDLLRTKYFKNIKMINDAFFYCPFNFRR